MCHVALETTLQLKAGTNPIGTYRSYGALPLFQDRMLQTFHPYGIRCSTKEPARGTEKLILRNVDRGRRA